jgi:hypothetical protein
MVFSMSESVASPYIVAEDLVDEYGACLIEPDEDVRRDLLALVWTEDCEVIVPEGRFRGREAVNGHITQIRERFGNATPMTTGEYQSHHDFLRFNWQIIDAAGDVIAHGVNFGERAADGRLRRVVVFRDGGR